MRALIIGTGKIGSAMAWELVQNEDVETVGLIDKSKSCLKRTLSWIGSTNVKIHNIDVLEKDYLIPIMQEYDVGLMALPDRLSSYKVIEAAIEARLNIVDTLEEYHRRPDSEETEGLELPIGMNHFEYGEWLHEKAKSKGITILDGLGFAPGLSNITIEKGIRTLDRADTAIARVGGIPAKDAADNHPLKYLITWSFEHVLREYMVDLQIIDNGKVKTVPALSGYETFNFNEFGVNEELEAAITPGMPSFIYTRSDLKHFAEKTIRWPGHYQAINTLKECGLLSLTPVPVNGTVIAPRIFTSKVLAPQLLARENEHDICVMYNTVSGIKNDKRMAIEFFMLDHADKNNNISSMARITGFHAAIGAVLLGKGAIMEKGIVAPEDAIVGDLYDHVISELDSRGITIKETIREFDNML